MILILLSCSLEMFHEISESIQSLDKDWQKIKAPEEMEIGATCFQENLSDHYLQACWYTEIQITDTAMQECNEY